ncbi:MAG: urease accessory protein UreE [Phenylobacterium sp.]|nr:urease accessory protein UreE [Phenylobacterium sp.]
MTTITDILPAGAWSGDPTDHVVLDYDGRHRRRIVLTGASGTAYLLDLAETTHLHDGDGLVLPGGGVVRVDACPEPLMEIRGETAAHLVRLAWHIGNRHISAQIDAERILIRRDHVIAHMLEHLGAQVREVDAPFDPEAGAYHGHGDPGHAH